MTKKGIIILIVFLSVVCVLMTGGFIYLLANNFEWGSFDFKISEGKLIDSIEYDNDVTILNIDTKSIDVYFEENDTNKYSLEIYSNNKKIDYSFNNENGVINLKAYNKTKGNLFIGFGAHGKVVVKIPKENSLNEFVINHKVGDIKIGNFKDLNGTINNSVGDLDIDTLNNVKIDLGIGDIDIKRVNKVEVKHSTGDLDIDYVNEFLNDSKTGDIKVNSINYSFNIISHTGDITINNADLKNNSFIDNKTGDIDIYKTSGVYVEAKTNTGDIKVNNNDRYAEYTLKIQNKTGDIKIN